MCVCVCALLLLAIFVSVCVYIWRRPIKLQAGSALWGGTTLKVWTRVVWQVWQICFFLKSGSVWRAVGIAWLAVSGCPVSQKKKCAVLRWEVWSRKLVLEQIPSTKRKRVFRRIGTHFFFASSFCLKP